MKCREAHKMVIQAQDRKLSLAERLALSVHLFICAACSNFRKQMDLIRSALRGFPPDEPR